MLRTWPSTRAKRSQGGFTLAELLVTVLLIGLIAAVAIPLYSSQTSRADATVARSEARNLSFAVQSLLLQVRSFGPNPTLVTTPSTGTPTSITLDNQAGSPASVTTVISMTPGVVLNRTEADNNTVDGVREYCVAVTYRNQTAYQGPSGPLSSCTNGELITASESVAGSSPLRVEVAPIFLSATLPASGAWAGCAYGMSTFVCVDNGSANAASSTDGTTWTGRTLPSSSAWTDINYGNGAWLALRSTTSANTIARTTDGITWSSVTMPATKNWVDAVYGAGTWLAVASDGTAARSANGSTWTAAGTLPITSVAAVTFGDGTFVAVGTGANAATGSYSSASSSFTWATSALPASQTWVDAAYGNGLFVVTRDGGAASSSNRGATWTASTTAAGMSHIGYGNAMFLIVGPGLTTSAYLTTNGTTWTTRTIASSGDQWAAPAYGNGAWVTLGRNSGSALFGI